MSDVIEEAETLLAKLKSRNAVQATAERTHAAPESVAGGPVKDSAAAAVASVGGSSAGETNAPPLSETPEAVLALAKIRFADSAAAFFRETTQDAKLALRLLKLDGLEIVPGEKSVPMVKKPSGELLPLNKETLTALLPPVLFPPAGVPGSGSRGGSAAPKRPSASGLNAYDAWIQNGASFEEFTRNAPAIRAARRGRK